MKLIAIGCSWGGLAALEALLEGLPDDLDGALVVAQHRNEQGSALEPLLQEHSRLPVREAEDKEGIEPGRVFLAPRGYHLLVEPGRLALSTEQPVHYARPSLDVLLESAADAYGEDCVGVVLTGASADGAAGLARVARRGGVALVQDPGEAERRELPDAALEAVPGATALPLRRLAGALAELSGTRAGAR